MEEEFMMEYFAIKVVQGREGRKLTSPKGGAKAASCGVSLKFSKPRGLRVAVTTVKYSGASKLANQQSIGFMTSAFTFDHHHELSRSTSPVQRGPKHEPIYAEVRVDNTDWSDCDTDAVDFHVSSTLNLMSTLKTSAEIYQAREGYYLTFRNCSSPH
jgi:hypothetical protein